jgi:membrane protease YdiL (CAAX protease family)
MSEAQQRIPAVLRGVAQPVLALVGALALTLLLTLPFVPTRERVEFSLRPAAGGDAVPHEQLERRVEALGLADEVRVLLVGGASRLVLEGVDEAQPVEIAIGDLLLRSGYQRDVPVRSEVIHMEGLLRAEPRALPLVMSIQAAVFLLAGITLARRGVPHGILEARVSLSSAALVGVAAGLAAVGISAVVGQLLKLVGLPVQEQAWLIEMYSDTTTLLRIAPWVVLIAPVAEEVFFRFYVFRHISAHAGFPAGLVISSLMFALIHFNFSGLLIYLGIGCVLAWAYRRTGRILAPIVGHATLNAIVLIATMLIQPDA